MTPDPADSPIPAISYPEQSQPAAARRAAFPYQFPRDTRRLGGKYSVDENSAILLRLFYFERRLSQALGSWTLAIPEFEVKLETGRHIFWHMDAARKIRERLTEQEQMLKKVDAWRDAGIDTFIEEMLSAMDTPQLLAGAHLVLGRALEAAYRQHIADTCPIADAPTIRIFKQILVDYEGMLLWAEQALAAYVAGGVDEAPVTRWRWHLSCLLASMVGVTGRDKKDFRPAALRCEAKPYHRQEAPARDSRFVSFSNTGEYHAADGDKRRFPHESYEARRM